MVFFMARGEAQSLALGIADSLYATGNYTKAINHYAKEGSVKASLQIARAYNAIGNYKKAIVQYQSVVDQNPDFQIAGFELGKLLIKAGKYDEAIKRFSSLVFMGKDNPEYQYFLGEAFRELDKPDSSLVAYKNAIRIDSTHLRSLFQLGKYFMIKRETRRALGYIEKALEFYPEDIMLINLKALVLFNDAAYEKAIPWFEHILELGEAKKYVYEKLAYCHYKNWDFEKAKAMYRIVLDMNPENPETYFNMAEAYRKNKQLDSAEVFIKKGMDVQKPIFAKGYSLMADIARQKNDLELALKYYKLAHNEDPKNAISYYRICTVVDQYYKDPKVKLEYYERYIERYGKDKSFFSSVVSKRISKLKKEIHFSKDQ